MTKSNNLLADYAAKKQDICIKNDTISDSLFREYGVNRGLRDVNGKGVLTGLTNISEIVSFKTGEDVSSWISAKHWKLLIVVITTIYNVVGIICGHLIFQKA